MKRLSIKKLRFSPEIEVEYPSYTNTGELYTKTKIKGWDVSNDCSLNNGIEYKPNNRNHLFYNKKSLEQIKNVIKTVKKYEGNTTYTCGLHIHVNIGGISEKEQEHRINIFAKNQQSIIKRFKVLENRRDYCHYLPEDGKKKLDIEKYNEIKGGYYALENETEFNTFEFRLFNGTLDFNEIKKAIKFCLYLVAYGKILKK